jgi:LPXTG-motif cell wall-anchored protein
MSDAELLIVLGGALALIAAAVFSKLRRKRRNTLDYWLPDERQP